MEFSLASMSSQCMPQALIHESLGFLNYKTENTTNICGEYPKTKGLPYDCLSKTWVPKHKSSALERPSTSNQLQVMEEGDLLSLFSFSVSDLKFHFCLQPPLSSSFRLASSTVCLLPLTPTDHPINPLS